MNERKQGVEKSLDVEIQILNISKNNKYLSNDSYGKKIKRLSTNKKNKQRYC